jgi:integrase/recombinase XerD
LRETIINNAMALLEVKKSELSFGRHTFATTVTLTNGVPIESISKMLGHTKLATTMIYARVSQQKIGAEMAILNKKLISESNR